MPFMALHTCLVRSVQYSSFAVAQQHVLRTSLVPSGSGGQLLSRSVLLGEEEWDRDEDGAGRQKAHQDFVRVEKLSVSAVTDGESNTHGDGGRDDLER